MILVLASKVELVVAGPYLLIHRLMKASACPFLLSTSRRVMLQILAIWVLLVLWKSFLSWRLLFSHHQFPNVTLLFVSVPPVWLTLSERAKRASCVVASEASYAVASEANSWGWWGEGGAALGGHRLNYALEMATELTCC